MNDIHAIIAAAERTSHRDSHSMDKVLCDHAIAMAEALARIDDLGEAIHLRDPAYCAGQMAEVAHECLARIEQEANRDG